MPPYIVYVKRIVDPARPTGGYLVAAYGPYRTAASAERATKRVPVWHPRFTDPQYYIGILPLHTGRGDR